MYKKLAAADIAKLHSEVNLYINQRLVITTTAITVFGVVMGLVAPVTSSTTTSNPGTQIQSLSLILPTVLTVMLGVMLWYCQAVLQQIHVISTYLVETKSSDWEDHYHSFAEALNLRSSSGNLPLFVFAALGLFSMLLSAVMYFVAYQSYSLKVGISFAVFIITSVIYWCVFINFWRQRDPKKFRKQARRRWQKILSEQGERSLPSGSAIDNLSEASFSAVWNNPDDDIYNDL